MLQKILKIKTYQRN